MPNDDRDRNRHVNGTLPVEEGEVRSVTIDTLDDQGDGIAKVERGFVVVVSGIQPGDKADVEITNVRESVAFAKPVTDPEVR
ncbi:TRAM domain-containing protein [Natrinema sp. DC36]|uniref:TRAM domain-containing protein n=1 Tax=Natrinema sp. DC36 TaxID=2878680 RepID=UPI0031F3268C